MKLSIIVPVYNVEEYLYECIDSILNQTFRNFELILVDDGSVDSCPQICDEYAKKDSRIKVIHKKNGGLSSARNAGLKVATGEFVTFVDSDDYLSNKTYENAFLMIKENNADIAIFGRYYVYSDNKKIIKEKQHINLVMDSAQATALMNISLLGYYDTAAWDKVYRRSLFSDILYPKNRISEDWFTTYKVFAKAKVIVYDSTPLYYYRQRNGSITHTYTKVNLDAVNASTEVLNFVRKNQKEYTIYAIFAFVFANIGAIDNLLIQPNLNFKKINELYKSIRPYFSKIKKIPEMKDLNRERKVQLFMLQHFFGIYIFIFKYIKKMHIKF